MRCGTSAEMASGEIILTCPIPQTLSRISLMTVRYKDDGVLNAGSQVVTALRQKRYVFNGITEGVDSTPQTIVETDSNLRPSSRFPARVQGPPKECAHDQWDADLRSQHAPASGHDRPSHRGVCHAVLDAVAGADVVLEHFDRSAIRGYSFAVTSCNCPGRRPLTVA